VGLFQRKWSATNAASAVTFPEVPGLVLLSDFLSHQRHEAVLEAARTFALQVDEASLRSQQHPRPSPAHNLNVPLDFIRTTIKVEAGEAFDEAGLHASRSPAVLKCEHFRHYGEDGHRLTYFRGNQNIPRLGLPEDHLVRLGDVDCVKQELQASRAAMRAFSSSSSSTGPTQVKWRMTLNHYLSTEGSEASKRRAGFPWHRDIEANGASTMILALGSPARLEFGEVSALVDAGTMPDGLYGASDSHDDDLSWQGSAVKVLKSVSVPPGALLILTGAARWKLLHRVARGEGLQAGERLSLVYGCW